MSLQSEEFVLYKIDEEQNIEIYGQPQINIESLYLTNLSLVYVVVTSNRAFRKKETQEVRICVKDIKILNGLPQIFIEEIRDENEELGWKLQIFLKTGGISFLINEYSTVKEMQKEKIKFMNELYKVLVGHPYSVDLMNEERVISSTQAGVRKGSEIGKNIADAVKVVPVV
ncbi:MAG: hypothetical protein IKT32_03785, partial [Clostridia bacterium]|nr:hypothetical protein [Clostridia bacterium]